MDIILEVPRFGHFELGSSTVDNDFRSASVGYFELGSSTVDNNYRSDSVLLF